MQLEPGLIEQLAYERAYVVRAAGGVGEQGGQIPVLGIIAHLALVAQQCRQPTRLGQRADFAFRHQVHDSGVAGMRLGAAQPGHVHVFAGHRPDHVRACHEDAPSFRKDHEVRQCRAVGRPAGRWPKHHRDLRHHARGGSHRGEHGTDGVQAGHALAQPSPAGMPEPDHGDPAGDRLPVGLHDHRAALRAQRAALHPRIASETDGHRPINPAGSGQYTAVAGGGAHVGRLSVEQCGKPRHRITRKRCGR